MRFASLNCVSSVTVKKSMRFFLRKLDLFFIFRLQTACQQGDDDDIDDSDQQAEFDAMLIEYAGDILPSLATAVGGQIFAPYFAGFLPLLLKKTVSRLCYSGSKSSLYFSVYRLYYKDHGRSLP